MKSEDLNALITLLKIPRLRKKLLINLFNANISLSDFTNNPSRYHKYCPLNENMQNILAQEMKLTQFNKLKEFEWLEQSNMNHIITYNDCHYPETLRNIPDPPILLYLVGDPDCLSLPQIAVVGSRKPSSYGKENAKFFSTELSNNGYCITSGLAYGIDAIAHTSTLQNKGKTIAVMGTGINMIYPAKNKAIAEKIIHNGAIISEFPLDTKANRFNFPKRNRVISGLSLGALIIESSIKSGTLITAKHANDQGRDVFAIPGNINHEESSGCHWLIQEGAKLVSCVEDILIELDPMRTKPVDHDHDTAIKNNKDQKVVINQNLKDILIHIDYQITALDSIIEKSGMPTSELSMLLFELEIEGLIESIPGGYKRK